MQPLEKVLSRVPNHQRSGKGYKACCPAHDDRDPSLSISVGDDGRVLLKCFAGCRAETIVNALGLTMADLFSDRHDQAPAVRKPPRQKVFQSPEDAARAYGFGEPSQQWRYLNQFGFEVGRVLRWDPDNPEGKKIIFPTSVWEEGWKHKAPLSPRPLFNLPQINATPDPVFIVEGEKCVDAMGALGLLATTSMGGSGAPSHSDWSDLAGRSVVILPDNDESGGDYADAVCGILLRLGATVRIVALAGLGEKEDVANLFDRCASDADRQRLREQIEEQTNTAKEITVTQPNTSIDHKWKSYQPFPVSSLPKPVASFVDECAAAIGCDSAFVALPVLTLMGAAIGNTRRLHMKSTYEVPAILWTGIVGDSGTGKTPALSAALVAGRDREAYLQGQKEPQRFLVGDTTREALAEMMASNPRGILCVRDELSGWFGSIDHYANKKGKCSADQPFYLSAYNGMPHTVDRRTGDQRHIYVPRASLWITGGIQPGILAQAMGKTEREAGLLARFLLACPPARPHKYSDDEVSSRTKAEFDAVIAAMFAMDGNVTLTLAAEAKQVWTAFHDRTAEEALGLSGDLMAAWSKFRETALRIALIIHLADTTESIVSAATMERAIILTEWFKNETQRVYAILSETDKQQAVRSENERLLAWLEGREWVTVRDIERGPQCFRGTGKAAACLNQLIATGMVEQKALLTGENGGQPSTAFRLIRDDDPVPVAPMLATQPPQTREKEGSVAVAGGEVWTKL